MPSKPLPGVLKNLRRLNARDVAVLNTYSRLFQRAQCWSKWIEESLGSLLMSPGDLRLELLQSSKVANSQEQNYAFAQEEVLIGRGTGSHIVLTQNAISRRHARIFLDQGVYKIEDLNSAAGTYLNGRKMAAGQPEQLKSGDEISIFPHVFRVKLEKLWHPDNDIQLSYAASLTTVGMASFMSGFGAGMCCFNLQLHPTNRAVYLVFSRRLLDTIIDRLVRGSSSCLTDADLGLLEFIVLIILERANRELRFPYQFSLTAADEAGHPDEPGLCLKASVRLNGSSGLMGAFFPADCLHELNAHASLKQRGALPHQLGWSVAVQAGSIRLSVSELADLERGDVLLLDVNYELSLPQKRSEICVERGWAVERLEESNSFQIKNYFERIPYMLNNPELEPDQIDSEKPDLDALPISMQVVIGHVELSLGELETLTEGTVIDLGAEITNRVQLFGHGKRLGSAELVDLDGKLGIQICDWTGN